MSPDQLVICDQLSHNLRKINYSTSCTVVCYTLAHNRGMPEPSWCRAGRVSAWLWLLCALYQDGRYFLFTWQQQLAKRLFSVLCHLLPLSELQNSRWAFTSVHIHQVLLAHYCTIAVAYTNSTHRNVSMALHCLHCVEKSADTLEKRSSRHGSTGAIF